MAVELDGNVRMRGEAGSGIVVRVLAEDRRLRLVSGNELVGDWQVGQIGITALQDGFSIKAEGEEFVLRTEDDVALAAEIGIATASPRLARLLAARHNPEDPGPAEVEDAPVPASNLAAIGFALAGAMIVLGGVFLDLAPVQERALTGEDPGSTFQFWLAFVIGGVLMIAAAFVMSLGTRFSRAIAVVILVGVIVVFGYAVADTGADASHLAAYGFIAGGLVVGVAVMFSGSSTRPD